MCATTPARWHGLDDVGLLAPGRLADICLVDDEGTVKFNQVQIGAEGTKWAGFTFMSACASDERYPIKNRETKADILARIAADPFEALKRYGQEIGCCGHCGKTNGNFNRYSLDASPSHHHGVRH